MNNLPSLAPNCLFRMRLAPPKALVHALFLTGVLLGLFLLLPVNAQEGISDLRFAPPPTKIEDDCPNCDNHLYLPLIAKPPFVLTGGSIKLNTGDGSRAEGLTVFSTIASVSASELGFSLRPDRTQSCAICSTQPFTYTIPISVSESIIGVQQTTITFWHGQSSLPVDFTFFYIPNGDFEIPSLPSPWQSSAVWTAPLPTPNSSSQLHPPKIISSTLLLSPLTDMVKPLPSIECAEAYRSSASASLAMYVPPHSDYKLYVRGMVYTQDQNPSNTATYDAFEIAINGHMVYRRSNQQPPISCSNPIYRQIPVEADIPLDNYAGEIVLSLENHLRYDNYFYTYTEIDMVWIDR